MDIDGIINEHLRQSGSSMRFTTTSKEFMSTSEERLAAKEDARRHMTDIHSRRDAAIAHANSGGMTWA